MMWSVVRLLGPIYAELLSKQCSYLVEFKNIINPSIPQDRVDLLQVNLLYISFINLLSFLFCSNRVQQHEETFDKQFELHCKST
jgi:hypothetical protein